MVIKSVNLERLRLALLHEVPDEVLSSMHCIGRSEAMDAARLVMNHLVGDHESEMQNEVCVKFLLTLLKMMVTFVNELIRERVAAVDSDEVDRDVLSKRMEIAHDHTAASVSSRVRELEECDGYMRSLRRLESDVQDLKRINSDDVVADGSVRRTRSTHVSRFPSTLPTETVVERCLLTNCPSSGMYWLSKTHPLSSANKMRELARLIAYLFIKSTSWDSFFVGIHVLRNSGHHVQETLEAIYKDTSIKFVRDRISCHLAHRGFIPNKNLSRMEQLYPNNCYLTELNRGWTRIASYSEGQGRIQSSDMTDAVLGCNIPDIPEHLERPYSGQIGSVSQEESLAVIKCALCQDMKHRVVSDNDAWDSAHHSVGYLHITVSWIERMTDREVTRIIMEAGGQAVDLEYAVLHKDWRTISETDWPLSQFESGPLTGHGHFLDRIIRETALKRGFTIGMNPDRTGFARITSFLSPDSGVIHSFEFHVDTLKWLLDTNRLPQVALLYLRRYSLGGTLDEADKLIAEVGDSLKFMAHGRLGNLIHDAPVKAVEMLAVWMNNHIQPSEELLNGPIAIEFPAVTALVSSEPRALTYPDVNDILHACSFKGDISIEELLCDVFPDLRLEALSAVHTTAQSLPCGELDLVEYLTAQGRVSCAYSQLPKLVDQSKSLQRAARRVALYNLSDDGIVASAVALLDLCGEPTETLRVDVHCARSIAATTTKARTSVRDLFLGFDKGGGSQLLAALKLLEESAWATEPPIAAAEQPVARGLESPWHLVALFCRVHNLPRSLTLLHELARNGDWVMFLHESDIQQCPIETVRDVVQLYFDSDSSLRSHLNILLDVQGPSSPRVVHASSRSSGLSEVLSGNDKDWTTRHGDLSVASLTVEGRKNRIFYNQDDHRVLLQKSLSLFKFENARLHAHELHARGIPIHDLISVPNATTNDALASEIKKLDVPLSPRFKQKVISRNTHLESVLHSSIESTISSPVVEEHDLNRNDLMDGIRARKFSIHASVIRTAQDIEFLLSVLPELMSEEWCEEDFDQVLTLIHPERLETLGDSLRARNTDNMNTRRQFERIAYFAYAKAFVDEAKFDEFCKESHNLPAETRSGSGDCSSVSRLPMKFRMESSADDLLVKTISHLQGESANEYSLVGALAAVVKISCAFRDLGYLCKHLRANDHALQICSRLRQSGIVL